MDATDRAKQAAGIEAARMAKSGWVVGLGTGSTAAYAIAELGRRMRDEGAIYYGVPTSHSAELLARRQKIPVRTLHDVERIDLAIDGADEVDLARNLLKGSGGAHTREKIVDSFAELFVVVVDDSKLVSSLGHRMPVPLEVLPLAVPAVTRRIQQIGGTVELRVATGGRGHYGPIITDQGNMILDAKFPVIDNPKELERGLNSIPGVLENGIFAGMSPTILVGSTIDGTVCILS
jgi:ribose 5-phosphate isomerase A